MLRLIQIAVALFVVVELAPLMTNFYNTTGTLTETLAIANGAE